MRKLHPSHHAFCFLLHIAHAVSCPGFVDTVFVGFPAVQLEGDGCEDVVLEKIVFSAAVPYDEYWDDETGGE